MSYHRPCIPCSFSTAADCCRVSHVSNVSSPTSGVSFNHPGSFQTGLGRGSLTGFARGGAIFDLRQRRNAKDGKDGKVGHVKLENAEEVDQQTCSQGMLLQHHVANADISTN